MNSGASLCCWVLVAFVILNKPELLIVSFLHARAVISSIQKVTAVDSSCCTYILSSVSYGPKCLDHTSRCKLTFFFYHYGGLDIQAQSHSSA